MKKLILFLVLLTTVAFADNIVYPPGGAIVSPATSLPDVANTTALKAIPVANLPNNVGVYRQGYYAAGDAGSGKYIFSTTPCTLNGGAGDGGGQIPPNSGVGCWNLQSPNGILNLGAWGADPTHTLLSDTAVTNWYAACVAGGGHDCIIPPGNYKMSASQVWDVSSDVGGGFHIHGAGAFASNFDFTPQPGAYLWLHNATGNGWFYSAMDNFGVTANNSTAGLKGAMQIGGSYSDGVNGGAFRNMRVANTSFAAGSAGLVIRGFYNSRLEGVTTSDACNTFNSNGACTDGSKGDSLVIYQAAFSYFNGSFSGASNGIHITSAAAGDNTSNNKFEAMDIEVVYNGILIDSQYPQGAYGNSFDVGTYVWCGPSFGCGSNQGYALIADVPNTSSYNNIFDNPGFLPYQNPTDGSCTDSKSVTNSVLFRAAFNNVATPSVPSSTTQITNTTGRRILQTVYGGSVSQVNFGANAGTGISTPTTGGSISVILNPCDKTYLTYTSTPGLVWVPVE